MKTIVFILLLGVFGSTFCQTVEDYSIGKTYTFNVEELSSELKVHVYDPPSEEEKDVLILLDGQRLFTHGVSISQTFQKFDLSPHLLIIGISTPYPARFGYFTRQSKVLHEFIEKTLFPFVTKNYKTSERRLFFGWEYGGSMVVQSFIENPRLFSGYIAASPFPLEGKINQIDSLLASSQLESMLYINVEQEVGVVSEGAEKVRDLLLKNEAPDSLWKYQVLENEEHRSTPYVTLYHGLRNYYDYYPEIHFNNLDEFHKRGGLAYIYNYYQVRAEEYGFTSTPTPWTMFSATRTAIRANNYNQFDSLVKEFESSGYLTEIRLSRAFSVADYYLKNQNHEKAIEIYKALLAKNPNVAEPYRRLGDVYKQLGNKKQADFFYEQAAQKD